MNKIKVATPIVDEKEVEAVKKVLLSGMYASGPTVEQFEKELAEYIGVKYAVAVNSGTAALHLALIGLGVKPGDEVIVPAMSFFASASSVIHQGAIPVFCDVDNNYCMDPEDMKNKITDKTKAIIPVHLYGFAANMPEILKIAKENNLVVIEDCAQGIGTAIDGKVAGSFGDCGAFSFFATKNLTTGEGGIITTNNQELAEKAKMLRNHGMTSRDDHDYIGFNYRMGEMNAAIGIVQLSKLPEMNKKRIENSEYLLRNLKDIDWLIIEEIPENVTHSYFWCPIRIDEEELGMTTLELRKLLSEKEIGTRHRYTQPLYKQKALRDTSICPLACPTHSKNIKYDDIFLKNSEKFSGKLLGLPNHPNLTKEEMDYIIKILHEVKK